MKIYIVALIIMGFAGSASLKAATQVASPDASGKVSAKNITTEVEGDQFKVYLNTKEGKYVGSITIQP